MAMIASMDSGREMYVEGEQLKVKMLGGLYNLVVGKRGEVLNQNIQPVRSGGFVKKPFTGKQKALPMSEEF